MAVTGKTMKKLKLSDVLLNANELPWNESLYLPENSSTWNNSTEAIIESADAFEEHDESDNPVDMSKIGYAHILSCSDVTSISNNLKENKPNPSLEDLFEAFEFYLDNDAFI